MQPSETDCHCRGSAVGRRATEQASSLRNERELSRILEGLDRQIHIQLGPVKVIPVKQLDIENNARRRSLEPREVRAGKEVLVPACEYPDPVIDGDSVIVPVRQRDAQRATRRP